MDIADEVKEDKRGAAPPPGKSRMERLLDTIERAGNKVPHPALIFIALSAFVVLLSAVVAWTGASVTYESINPETHEVEKLTTTAQSLLSIDGIRFMYEGVIPNFMNFQAIGVIIVAMLGVGVAEASGLIDALIRKLVKVAPAKFLTYILVFIGIVSSVAADAGYLVLIPLAATAFLSMGRHPLAGLAASFAAVASVFSVNILIKPLDGILVGITNDAIHMMDPSKSIGLTANIWFSVASVFMLTVVVGLITDKIVAPRLGAYTGEKPAHVGEDLSPDEQRGLKWALWALLGVVAVFLLLTIPSGAPLRNPETGALIGDSPFMLQLIVAITILFLAMGVAYGRGAKTLTTSAEVMKSMEKSTSGLGSLIFLLFIISQFLAYFTYSNIPTLIAVGLGDILEKAGLPALFLLVGFIIVVALLDLIMTGAIPKWAIFAPVFVPLLMRLNVEPDAVLAAYRVGDSPMNSITPLNAYFALIVTFAMKYQKNAGVGTVVALMLPYVAIVFGCWIVLFVIWQLLGLPWGL
jgi:aminobenzoyl-glutamate transport protein